MVVEALFLIVTSLASARLSLKESKIEQNNTVFVLALALCLAGSCRRGRGWTISGGRRARRSSAFGQGRRLERVKSSRGVIVAAGVVSF